MGSWGNAQIAVVALGVALIVFFAGTTAAVAAGASPPTALWAAGGAVSGGLLGLLLPAPAPRGFRSAAVKAKKTALGLNDPLTAPTRPVDPVSGQTVTTAPSGVSAPVEALARSTSWVTVGALALVFVLLLVLAVCLAGGAIVPPSNFGVGSIQNLAKTVIALASAAGTGVIGLLVPSPSQFQS